MRAKSTAIASQVSGDADNKLLIADADYGDDDAGAQLLFCIIDPELSARCCVWGGAA